MTNHITLVGCGNMGSALLDGWQKSLLKAEYHVVKPSPLEIWHTETGITHNSTPDKRVTKSGTVILAVKPQKMAEALASVKPFIHPQALVISVAAGWKISKFENILGDNQPIVRTIPNLPSAENKGLTLAVANKSVTKTQIEFCEKLFWYIGAFEWLDDENLMNAASVVSGAGPAFIFHLVELLAKAGKNNGVPADLARRTARQVVIGSAAMLEADKGTEAETMRKSVTSPGGITEAALEILMNGQMQKLYDDAVAAAAKRGGELAKN